MPSPSPSAPKRAGKNKTNSQEAQSRKKSRTGCLTCKTRRMKCDETKPACLKCITSGRECMGYKRELRWSTKYTKYEIGGERMSNEPHAVAAQLAKAAKVSIKIEQDPELVADLQVPDLDMDGLRNLGEEVENEVFIRGEGSWFPHANILDEPMVVDNSSTQDGNGPPFEPFWDMSLQLLYDQLPWGEGTTRIIDQEDLTPDVPDPSTLDVPEEPGNVTLPSHEVLSTSDAQTPELSLSGPRNKSRSDFVPLPQVPKPMSMVLDTSTFLVEYWFNQVCTMWSAFDSVDNPFRILASNAWTHSESVFYSLQSMSAACLAEQMPHLKRVTSQMSKQAVQAIQKDPRLRACSTSFPADLIFSLFLMGTSVCWHDTRDLGSLFLRDAKRLLAQSEKQQSGLTAEDGYFLALFKQALVYWDMLSRVVSDDELRPPPEEEASEVEYPSPAENTQIIPHPWTGVGGHVQGLFGEALMICRRSRRRIKQKNRMTVKWLQEGLRDTEGAQKIEEALLAVEHPSLDAITETGDTLTPKSHFVYIAEAYRLAALLHLYQTFPDLVARRLPSAVSQETGLVSHGEWLTPLALQLIDVLKRVPPNSGTRSTQPLLYVVASSGLKFDMAPPDPICSPGFEMPTGIEDSGNYNEDSLFMPSSDIYDITITTTSFPPQPQLTTDSIKIAHARRFVLNRLRFLECSLPPKPIVVATQLVKTIWATFDGDDYTYHSSFDCSEPHWMDVMMTSGLQTIFG